VSGLSHSGCITKVTTLPTCDFCREVGIERPARYDFRSRFGSWANGCVEHYERHRASRILGTGHAQLLIAPPDWGKVRMDENGRVAWDEVAGG
jgi:hypothetical protein